MSDTTKLLVEISQIMASTVVDTFNDMFGQKVVTARVDGVLDYGGGGKTCVCLVLTSPETPARFYFSFDDGMLALVARNFFTGSRAEEPVVRKDIACAVANIVGTRVKNCLNGYGHKFEMTFPFVVGAGEIELPGPGTVHLHFAYNDDAGKFNGGGLIVNFVLREQQSARC